MTKRNGVLPGLFFSILSTAVFAGPVEFKQSKPVLREVPLNEFRAEVTQTFQSDFKRGRGFDENEKSNNNTNTWKFELEASHRVQIDGNWYLRLGVDLARYDFGNNRSKAPNTLNAYAGVLALEYFTDEGERAFFVETKPGVYFASDLRTDAIDAPTNVVYAYPLVAGKFYLIGGVTMALLREYPVLPIGGVLWHISEKWDLRAYLPEPKLVYKASDNLELWAGGEISGEAFRNEARSDAGARALNHTPVEYYELRGGGGLHYTPWQHFTIDLAAGWAFVRKFDFYRADVTQETEGAPYLKLAGTFDF